MTIAVTDRPGTNDHSIPATARVAAMACLRPLAAAVAALLTLATTWPVARAVLGGTFADPDDAMRLVGVRAWMAGQPWYDVSAARLDPPLGASMHWSRLVDVPSAGLIRLLGWLAPRMDAGQVEAWARIVLPTLLLAGLYAAVARLARVLLAGTVPAAALHATAFAGTFLSGAALVQFQPGRIGHHGPQTLLLVWAVASALAGLEAGAARQAAAGGALVALSLALGLETMPFTAGLCAGMVLLWVARGREAAAALRAFALGLGVALPLCEAAAVAPGHWLDPVCDALGGAHGGTALIVGAGSLALAALTGRLRTPLRRLAGASVVAAAALAFVAAAYPACLRSPFAGVDPLVRELWLGHVVESLPLPAFLAVHPAIGLSLLLPTALGVAGCLWAAARLQGLAAARFAVLAGLGALGLALGCWQVRVFTSVAPLALCGGFFAVAALHRRLAATGLRHPAILAGAALLPFTATAWAVALPGETATAPGGPACLDPAALAPLAALPPGRVAAPLVAGSHLLEATPHAVFAAPYHRNDDGNRFVFDVFLASPDVAQALLTARGAAFVMTCDGLGETARLAARAPAGLAARLAAGTPPSFLRPLPLGRTPWHAYAVLPPG